MNTTTGSWIEAMRLRTLPVSVAGVLAGTACALMAGKFLLLPAVICLVFAIIAQIAINFANEYYDFRNGLDRKGRQGFRRGVTEGDISPRAMLRATYILLVLDSLLGLSLVYWGGPMLIPVGIAIALFAVGYSAGPYPLSHHGLGDVAVIIFFGIVPVMFTAYLQCGSLIDWPSWLAIGGATGMMAANVLIVNNYRDADDDRAVGKHTTVVIFGRPAMSAVYLLFSLVALALLAAVTSLNMPRFPSRLMTMAYAISATVYVQLWRRLRSLAGAPLNDVLRHTAMTMLAVCVCILTAAILTYFSVY